MGLRGQIATVVPPEREGAAPAPAPALINGASFGERPLAQGRGERRRRIHVEALDTFPQRTTVRQLGGAVRAGKVLREERTKVLRLSHPRRSAGSNSAGSSVAGPSHPHLAHARLAATARRRPRRYLDGVAGRRARATKHVDHQIGSKATEMAVTNLVPLLAPGVE